MISREQEIRLVKEREKETDMVRHGKREQGLSLHGVGWEQRVAWWRGRQNGVV